MKKLLTFTFVASAALFSATSLTSCDSLGDVLPALTDGDIANGLKSALAVGTDSSVKHLNAPGGYLTDAAVKILLPEQVQNTLNKVRAVDPTGAVDQLMLGIVGQMNGAAEDAAKEAAPIFKSAITSMTITDAKDILFGADNAATTYLSNNTRPKLVELYAPKIEKSIEKVGLGTAWGKLATKVNGILNSPLGGLAGGLANVKPLPNSLSEHITGKALDGMFLKVQGKEDDIRKKSGERVNDILKRVFGELDKK